MRRIMYGTLLAAILVAAAAWADEASVTEMSPKELQGYLNDSGYAGTIKDSGAIQWKIDGMTGNLLIADDKESIQFYAAISGGKMTLSKANEWNKTHRYSRCYIDDDGDPALELDLDLVGGVSEARVADFLLTCVVSYREWFTNWVE
jgi:hypothetical protein